MARRIFLSFAAEDKDQVNGFRILRWNNQVDIDFFDSSLLTPVQSVNIEYIKRSILERMNNTSVTVVLIGPTTYKSAWVDWEIKQSISRGNGVLGIRLKDQSNVPVPPAMQIQTALVGNWSPHDFENWIEQAAKLVGR